MPFIIAASDVFLVSSGRSGSFHVSYANFGVIVFCCLLAFNIVGWNSWVILPEYPWAIPFTTSVWSSSTTSTFCSPRCRWKNVCDNDLQQKSMKNDFQQLGIDCSGDSSHLTFHHHLLIKWATWKLSFAQPSDMARHMCSAERQLSVHLQHGSSHVQRLVRSGSQQGRSWCTSVSVSACRSSSTTIEWHSPSILAVIREVLHVEIRIFFRNTAAQVENDVEDSETFSEKALFSERTFRQLSSVHDQGSCKIAVRFYDVTPAKHFVDS